MSSFIQFIKLFISGNTPQGMKFRTLLSIILTFSVFIIEIGMYGIYWNVIPDMIQYDYDFSGQSNDLFEKKWIWYNVLFQIFICAFIFLIKYVSYKTKRVHQIVYDEKNRLISIIDKRFLMFAWEISMLFVTTEQGYMFALVDIFGSPMCDDIVTIIFLFWFVVLVLEFRADLKILSKQTKKA
ncbi:MAG: hypothetical protein IJ870_00385 [Alphaproteobacteria bacterium]|nr:hypothetical protein [Alphaproteobacteria bacterium]